MRKHALKLASLLGIALALTFLAPSRAAADGDDPPSRVARLSHTDGPVSFDPAGTDDWIAAVTNRPMTTGDKLWSDNGARAELHIGSASLRIGSTTGFSFLNLTDDVAQIQLTEGTLRVRVKRLQENETFEIDTPNLAFSVLRPGTYRVNVNESGDTTIVAVRGGEGEVTGGGQAYSVHANQTASFAGTDQLDADVQEGVGGDDFDQWCADRDLREDRSASARYVSPDVIGYEDLDANGAWRPAPGYGYVWYPNGVAVGWAPYHYGHWVYIAPWGYTWVEDEPWGFAPFHYGRWVVVGGVWGWVPAPAPVVGVAYVRPVYAPALVAWVGGPHFAVGVGVGGGFAAGAAVAWFPLGPREVFVPSYPVSRTYVTNVNVTNTTVNTTVVNNYYTNVVVNKNVSNVTYVNQRVTGAVTATSGTAFSSGQPVARNVVVVNQRDVVSAPAVTSAPAVAPTRQAVLGTGAPSTVRPPAAFANRAVVAKTTPPPPPPAFAKQQAAIQANGGRPLAAAQFHQLQPANVQGTARANVRIAPPATAVTPQNTPAFKGGQPNNNNKPNNVPANGNTRVLSDRPPTTRPPTTNAPVNTNSVNTNSVNKPPANTNSVNTNPANTNSVNKPPVNTNSNVEVKQPQPPPKPPTKPVPAEKTKKPSDKDKDKPPKNEKSR